MKLANLLPSIFRDNPQRDRIRKARIDRALAAGRRAFDVELMEPRILLSGDFTPEAAVAIADGLDQVAYQVTTFINTDGYVGDRVPILLQAEKDSNNHLVYEAPTIKDLLSATVDANGDGHWDNILLDGDETVLDDLDTMHGNSDGTVDTGEFLRGFLFDPIHEYLNEVEAGDSTALFEYFLNGTFPFFGLDVTLNDFSGSDISEINFHIDSANVADTTENPDAEITFRLGFELSITRNMPIDLGLEADALHLLAFTGTNENPGLVMVPVTSTLTWAFDFGVLTGGKDPGSISYLDFFVRKADDLAVSVESHSAGLDFNFNIGFLGAEVLNASLDVQADVDTALVDPDDPAALGFSHDQLGVEETGGVVIADDPIPSVDLAHDVGFFLRVGNVGISTPVNVIADDNSSFADVITDITSALSTAGLSDIVTASLEGGDTVRLELVPVSASPLGFADEFIGDTSIVATPAGDGDTIYEYSGDQTFLLSLGGGIPKLVVVHFADSSHTDLGFNNDQEAVSSAVVAPNEPSVFDISGNADFTVTAYLNDGSEVTDNFAVTPADTAGDVNVSQLAADIDGAMSGTTVYPYVIVTAVDGHVQFGPFAGNVSAIRVQASNNAITEIGFSSDATATLGLLASNNATADLSSPAHFKIELTVDDGGPSTETYQINVPDNDRATLVELASDIDSAIDSAIGENRINVSVSGGKIQLTAVDTDVLALSIITINEDIDDLVLDVGDALAAAGFGGQVTASANGGNLALTASQSLEISHTLTFDAGITWSELVLTPASELFASSEGADSNVELTFPVSVLPGIEDDITHMDFQPEKVNIVGRFDPFDSPAAEFDTSVNRFNLMFTLDPTVDNQNTVQNMVPMSNTLDNQIKLVNFAESLNFSLVTPESMIGFLGALGTVLQQFSQRPDFSSFDIPFADATLSDLMNFTDNDRQSFSGLIDLLLYDTGGDGVDPSPKANDNDRLLMWKSENGTSFLIPTFYTAQTLETRLAALLDVDEDGDGGINATYNKTTDELTYQISLNASGRSATSPQLPYDDVNDVNIVGFEYDVPLDPFDKLAVDESALPENRRVEIRGRSGLDMTFGVNLMPPGFLVFGDTPLDELNAGNGVDISDVNAVTGAVDIAVIDPPTSADKLADLPPAIQQLIADATFEISFDGGMTSTAVTVKASSTLNQSMADFVADVNNAIVEAGIADKIVADASGLRLVLKGVNPSINFRVTTVNLVTFVQIGLIPGTDAAKGDFVVITRDGMAHTVSLDGLVANPDLDDLLLFLNGISPSFSADFNADHTGLRLQDHTGGAGEFRVNAINGSKALLHLGFLVAGDEDNEMQNRLGDGDPNLIEGGGIGITSLDDRFFVRDAQIRIDGVSVKTPDGGVLGQGLYGIVGVDVTVDGEFIANVTAQLTDPNSNGEITLAELLAKTGVLDAPVVTLPVELHYDNLFSFFGEEFEAGDVLITSTAGDSAVVVGIKGPGVLLLANVKGDFADNESFQAKGKFLSADVDGALAPTDDFGDFTLGVTVQPGFDDALDLGFDADFDALDGQHYDIPFTLTDLGQPFPATLPSTSALNLGLLGDLEPFDALSYQHFETTLNDLQNVLVLVNANFTELYTTLPAINRSVGQLLDLLGGFKLGVDNAEAVLDAAEFAIGPDGYGLPALRLQDMARALRGAFGLPVGIDPEAVDSSDFVFLDYDTANDELLLTLNLHDELSTKLGLDIFTGVGSPNLTSAGVLEVFGFLDVILRVAIDLDTPTDDHVFLLDTTSIAGGLHVQGEGQEYAGGEAGLGLVFRSSLGPLAVFIQDGDVLIDFKFKLPGLDLGMTGRKLLKDIVYSDFLAPVVESDVIDIVLPMFYNGEGPANFIGEFSAVGTVASNTVTQPDFSAIAADITSGAVVYDPFENILLAIDTLDLYLELLSDNIATEILGIQLPFVGDQMGDVLFIEDFRSTLVRTLKNGIENSVNPNPDTKVTDLLTGLFVGGPLTGYLMGAITNPKSLGGPADTRYRQWNFTVHHSDTITIDDFDIGPDHLTFDVNTQVTVQFDWSIDIRFGVNYGEGAYMDLSGGNEVDLELTIRTPNNMSTTGTIGFLVLNVKDPDSNSGAKVSFDVDVQNGGGADPLLGFADIGSLNPVATITGEHLLGSPQSATYQIQTKLTPQTIGLPGLAADFVFDWLLPATSVASLNGDAVTSGIQKIALNNMTLDPLSGLKQLLGEPFEKVAEFAEPFMPVIDLLSAPIPILSDIAGEPFTLLDLAAIFGDSVPDTGFIEAIADILDVITTVGDIVDAATLDPIALGNFTLYDIAPGVDYFNPADPTKPLGWDPTDLDWTGDPNTSTPGLMVDDAGFAAGIAQSDFLQAAHDGTLVDGLEMPIFADPTEAIGLLVNLDADLVKYALPPLSVGFDYRQVFPVWGPLAVSIEISFAFGLDFHAVGFDTSGFRRYAEGGFRNPALIFDGFFLDDEGDSGADEPEITFEFGLTGAAEINLGIARAGVEGGIDSIINFDWHDSIPDTNVHFSEIIGNILAEGGNILAPFDVSGAMTFSLSAFLEISVLGIDLDFPITPEVTLFEFNPDFDRAPLLGEVNDGTLFLHMGPTAEDRLNGDTSDGNEEFFLERDGNDVKVWSPKLGVNDPQVYKNVTYIVGIGGEGDDKIHLSNFDGSTIRGEFDMGVGDDLVEFTGTTASTDEEGFIIIGGLGNDTLYGSHLNDKIYGGEGNDKIKGNGGYDILFGDSGRVAGTFITSRILDSDGADDIDGGDGDDIVIGGGGSDVLRGGAGLDLILGDGGRFDYTMSGNHINLMAFRPAEFMPTPITSYKDPDIISAEIDALLDFVLDKVRSTELGFGGNDQIFGDGGDDIILSGTGDDHVEGGADDDFIYGGKGFDDIHGGSGKDYIFGGDQADTLYGDDGDDVMSGGAGNDFMRGNADDDVMKGDTGADVMFGDAGNDQVFGQTEPDVLFGGIGNDLVVGGSSNDIMFGDDGLVAKLDPGDGSGLRVIGNGNLGLLAGQWYDDDPRTLDLIITDVVTGDGNDIMSGDAGEDIMLGGGGNDLMGGDVDPRLPSAGSPTELSDDVLIGDGGKITFDHRRFRSIETVIGPEDIDANVDGHPFNDVIYGDNGNDYIFGGRGSDFLFGGHGKVVVMDGDPSVDDVGASRGATDMDARDNDIIVGDNGEMLFADGTIPGNWGRLEIVRTTDQANITGGHEYAEGELGNDVIFGGVNGSIDVLLGNAGNDVILGDNGELNFAFDGDTNLDTLDLIRSYRDGLGGIDWIYGKAGDDVLIGGTAGDLMYGDDATASSGAADGEDIMLGDNGDIFLINDPAFVPDGANDDIDIMAYGRLLVRVAAMAYGTTVDRITTTDSIDLGDPDFDTAAEVEAVGGGDTMSGNAKADIMIGGVNGGGVDMMYGDQETTTPLSVALDGDDVMLGDNGLLDFTYLLDTDRNTVDLIRSFEDGLGGHDAMSGNKGLDVAIGGSGGDTIYGDDASASAGSADLADLLLGDNADIFLVARAGATGGDLKAVLDAPMGGSAVQTIRTTDGAHPEYGGVDTISGNAKGDIIAGGVQG
ncbi:MAG TPA: calcium-binding protein, partial [Terriglobia bacterium]|nr:calcium-binding protein [Terriglobia bacterium]